MGRPRRKPPSPGRQWFVARRFPTLAASSFQPPLPKSGKSRTTSVEGFVSDDLVNAKQDAPGLSSVPFLSKQERHEVYSLFQDREQAGSFHEDDAGTPGGVPIYSLLREAVHREEEPERIVQLAV